MITLGVLADTHVPDRTPGLRPEIEPIFREAGVQAILHAGDVCVQSVLEGLKRIAPVYAVRGNRDWFLLRSLPKTLQLSFGGSAILLAHGHISLTRYLFDKVRALTTGVDQWRYMNRLVAAHPEADVIVFGHIHRQINQCVNGVLLFNPGSACCPDRRHQSPSVGLLHISPHGDVRGEILNLTRSNFS